MSGVSVFVTLLLIDITNRPALAAGVDNESITTRVIPVSFGVADFT
jgi:hypothetical protein